MSTVASAFERATAVEPLGALSARVTQEGRLCAIALAAFAVDLAGVVDYASAPPKAPALAMFFEEDGELWSRDGVLLAQSRQLALLLGDRP